MITARPGRWSGVTPESRFWAKVKKTDGCWERGGANNGCGYSLIEVAGRRTYAHRYAWEISNGPIPKGLFVLHKCDNPPCVRPDHLRIGTHTENMIDCGAKGRNKLQGNPDYARKHAEASWKTRRSNYGPSGMKPFARATKCPRGHEYSLESASRTIGGSWRCRICRRNGTVK